MRPFRILAWIAGGVLAVPVVLFGAAQTPPGQQMLASVASSLASAPGARVQLTGLHGFFPTEMHLDKVELADARGVWLTVDDVRLDWSFTSLLSGRVRIEGASAKRVEVARAPDPGPPAQAKPAAAPSLPVGIDLQSLAIDDLHVGAALAQVDAHWKLAASALLPAEPGEGWLKLSGARLDGPAGRLSADLQFDTVRRTIAGEAMLDEGKGGLFATLLERPDLDRLTARLITKGNEQAGTVDLSLAAGDVASLTGKAGWQPKGEATDFTFRLEAAGPGLPASPLAEIVRRPVVLTADGTIARTLITLGGARLTAGPLEVGVSGRYDRTADRLETTTTLTVDEPGIFAPLLAGVVWRGLRVEAKADVDKLATKPRGVIRIDGAAEDLAIAALVPGFPSLGRTTLAARIDAADGALRMESLQVGSALASVKAAGTYGLETKRGDAKATISVPSLAPLSTVAGRDLVGSAAIDVTATSQAETVTVGWKGTLRDLGAPGVPRDLVATAVTLSGTAALGRDEAWTVRDARVESSAATFAVSGTGRAATGTLDLSLGLPALAALQADVSGAASVKARVTLRGTGTDLSLSADLQDVAYEKITAKQLAIAADASLDESGAASGSVKASGELATHPLQLEGKFSRDAAGGIVVPSLKGQWASAVVDVADLVLTGARTSGQGRLQVAKLQEIATLLGLDLAGSLDAEVTAHPLSPNRSLGVRVHAADLHASGLAVGSLDIAGTIEDPTGRATTDLTLDAKRIAGASGVGALKATARGDLGGLDITMQASGATSATLAARVEKTAQDIVVALQRLDARYSGIPVALQGATRLHLEGGRVRIDPTRLRVGGGGVALRGVLDPVASDLSVELSAFPLALIDSLAPGTNLAGTLNAQLRVQGASSAPRVNATYAATGIRVVRPGTALVPALALQGTATVAGQQATLDARLSTTGTTAVSIKGKATLPSGRAQLAATAAITGTIDVAPFAPMLGNDVRGITGTVRPNLSVEVAGSRVSGSGTVDLANGAVWSPDAGLRLDNGEGRLVLQGETLQVQRLAFRTGRSGTVTLGGSMRLDLKDGMVLDLSLASQRALLVSRPDMVATVSSNMKITGSTVRGIDISGPMTIDRAEIFIGAAQSADYPTLEVREINKPGAAPPPPVATNKQPPRKPPPPPTALQVRLAIDVSAPQGVFVRGRGLDAEMGGQAKIAGIPSAPTAIGGLTVRRGEFNLGGRSLNFSRGVITLDNLNTIDPRLDFLATTNVQSATIGVAITGTSREPRIEISSVPSMPSDEAMALLIFGRPASTLGASELLQVANAVAELSGHSPGGGVLARLRKGLGLDRLNVGGADKAAPTDGSPAVSLEAGRYVAPGVYVGAKQGASGTSSRGVVQLEVIDHVKIEADVGADSNGRVGVKMEWDY